MASLRRGLVNYVAPPGYAAPSAETPHFGHVPFDIAIRAMAAAHHNFTDGSPADFQLWNDGAVYPAAGPVNVASGGKALVAFDPAIVIPGVTAGNIDGASRFGIQTTSNEDASYVALAYDPVDPANAGKHIMGVGSKHLADPGANGMFGAVTYYFGPPGGWSRPGPPSSSDVFASNYEADDTGRVAGDNEAIAVVPWARPGTLADFLLVVRDVAGPDGIYKFHVRVNGATVLTIATTASATRLWTATPATVDVPFGALVCWQAEVLSGTNLAGELLWSFKAAPAVVDPWGGPWGEP